MKKILLSTIVLLSSVLASAQCSEIFISEYVEGWSNNKAIELYNPTANAINLGNYRLDRHSNGSPTADENQKLQLSGTIEAYSTYVLVIDKRNPDGTGQEAPVWDELQVLADAFFGPDYDVNNVMYFNGNDALALRRNNGAGNGIVIDIFGKIGEDPGNPSDGGGWNNVPPDFTWAANGAEAWTTDHSLIRKPGVTAGDITATNAFDPSVEWDSIPAVITGDEGFLEGNWASLGNHESVCNPASGLKDMPVFKLDFYPNPASNGELFITSEKSIQKVEIISITGETVQITSVANQPKFTLILKDFASGIYFIKTTSTDNAVSTRKLVIK